MACEGRKVIDTVNDLMVNRAVHFSPCPSTPSSPRSDLSLSEKTKCRSLLMHSNADALWLQGEWQMRPATHKRVKLSSLLPQHQFAVSYSLYFFGQQA